MRQQHLFLVLTVVLGYCLLASLKNRSVATEKGPATTRILRVGAGQPYATPSAAAAVANDGDVVEILAGTYLGDVAVWPQNNLTLRAVHGHAHLKAEGNHAEGKAIWVIKGNNTSIEGIEFSGCRVPDRNGAGIRMEGAGLLIRGCYFHNNEMGILTGDNSGSEIVIQYSEFASNFVRAADRPIGHNIYIGNVKSFTLHGCYVHDGHIGHNVKSRAEKNFILYNRIMDEHTGTSSYLIDLPNGGVAFIIGNLIQEGRHSQNYHLISYGAEGLQNKGRKLYIVNNTMVSDQNRAVYIRVAAGTEVAKIINNIFVGNGDVLHGRGELTTNLVLNESAFGFLNKSPKFANSMDFDYHLKQDSPAIDRGSDPGMIDGFPLLPIYHYEHKAKIQPRPASGRIDIGAYEYKESLTKN